MKSSMPFRRWSSKVAGTLLMFVLGAKIDAQPVIVPTISGLQYRYHGDTIWRERDTTATRTIFRGDTVVRSIFTHGRITRSYTYLVIGDSARLLESRDGQGRFVESSGGGGMSRTSLDFDRTGIETALRNAETEMRMRESEARMQTMMERARAEGRTPPERPEPLRTSPTSPKTKQTYPISANKTIEQLGDTVRYITGCAARPPADTTIYLLSGTERVQRLSPSPRSFDKMMVGAIVADMNSVLLRQRVRPTENPAMKNVPNISPWPCDKR